MLPPLPASDQTKPFDLIMFYVVLQLTITDQWRLNPLCHKIIKLCLLSPDLFHVTGNYGFDFDQTKGDQVCNYRCYFPVDGCLNIQQHFKESNA